MAREMKDGHLSFPGAADSTGLKLRHNPAVLNLLQANARLCKGVMNMSPEDCGLTHLVELIM